MKQIYIIGCLLLLSVTVCMAGEERQITLDEVPAKVKNNANKLLEGMEVERAQIETESNGDEVYEIIGVHEGVVTEVDLYENGEIQEYEKELPEKYVPFAVRKSIESMYPGIQFKRFEASHNKHHKVVKYEIEAIYNGKTLDLEVSPGGRKIVESDA